MPSLVIEGLRTWLDATRLTIPLQMLMGKALTYLDRPWPKLGRAFEDGRVARDTNAVENVIRPLVLGRKNWLFADTTAGGSGERAALRADRDGEGEWDRVVGVLE